jgi:hypothetical protein
MESHDDIIDAFVERVNSSDRERLRPKDVPEFLRVGAEDRRGCFDWRVKRVDYVSRTERLEERLQKRFPRVFYSLISRYAFPAFEIPNLFLFANTGDPLLWHDLSGSLFIDGVMSSFLLDRGYIQIGDPYEGNYDPVCLDVKDTSEPLGDCPLVWLDHEEILCNNRLKVVRQLAPSFEDFISAWDGTIVNT